MKIAFAFLGGCGMTLALIALIPNGMWIYLLLLVCGTALITFAICEADEIEEKKPLIREWRNIE